MSYGISKKDNEYARAVADIDAPKTVWMAIALSLARRIHSDVQESAHEAVLEEWKLLYENGIVPQKPRLSK